MKISQSLLITICIFFLISLPIAAQDTEPSHQAQWEAYELPTEEYVRVLDQSKGYSMWVPVAWKKAGEVWTAPNTETSIMVITEQVPEGYGIANYVTGMMQGFRKQGVDLESVKVRHVLLGGIEGREIILQLENTEGAVVHQTYWVVEVGTLVYAFVFSAGTEVNEKFEPYFKRLVMSVRFNVAGHWDTEFETLRTKFGNSKNPSRDALSAQLSESIRGYRESSEKVIEKVTELSTKSPEVVLEMLTDYDPNVRGTAMVALGKVDSRKFAEVLIWALDDKDEYCQTLAAKALIENDPELKVIKNNLLKLSGKKGAILNLAVALPDEKSKELAEELLKSNDENQLTTALQMAVIFPLKGLHLPYAKIFNVKSVEAIGYGLEAIRLRHPVSDVAALQQLIGTDSELWAIHALGDLAPLSIKPQLQERQKFLTAKYEALIKSKGIIQVPGGMGTPSLPPPPVDAIPKTGKKSKMVMVPGVRGIINAPQYDFGSSPAITPPDEFKKQSAVTKYWSVIIEIEDTFNKISLRDRWATAGDDAARRVILADASKNDRIKKWSKVTLKQADKNQSLPKIVLEKLKNPATTGETLFPKDATLYLRAPDFEQTIDKLDAALSGIQMATVRDQMTFALLLNSLKAQIRNRMDLAVTGSASKTLGIDLHSPVSIAAWAGQENTGATAESAVVVRVLDRARFERTLTKYQSQIGNFDYFVPVVSGGARVASVTPALMPLIFYGVAAMANSSEKPDNSIPKGVLSATSVFSGSSLFIRREKIGEVPLTVISKAAYNGLDESVEKVIYIAYLGETAVIAPNREALLTILKSDKPVLAENATYALTKNSSDEMVFFSQPDQLLSSFSDEIFKDDKDDPSNAYLRKIMKQALGTESGSVRLTPNAWDTNFKFQMGDNDFIKTLRPFKTSELSAPRDLFPKNTLFYAATVIEPKKYFEYSDKLDADFQEASKGSKKEKTTTKFATTFSEIQKLVTPHLQGEISFGLLNIRGIFEPETRMPSVVLALKLKDDSLAKTARAGLSSTAFRKTPNEMVMNSPVYLIQNEGNEYCFLVTDNYFIVGNDVETLKLLESKEKFASSREFIRPAQVAPDRLALFTTYNMDATFEEAHAMFGKGAEGETTAKYFIETMSAWAHAFHSQRMFLSFAGEKELNGQLGISFDREGQYTVGAMNRKEFDLENALIAPRGLSIAQPTKVTSLKLKVTSAQPGVVVRVRDDISKFSSYSTDPTSTDSVLITTSNERRIPDNLTVKLPVSSKELELYLKPSTRINSTAPEIINLAKQIVGKEKDGRRVADLIGKWTFENLKWKRVSSTSVETLASREADCLEHAELYTALARSVGLPTRVVIGAAFGGGSFGAHAWVEIYLGKWVEVDPTWGLNNYVDATHLRFDGNGFSSYAQLNQVNFEVTEVGSFTPEYQRNPVELVKHLVGDENSLNQEDANESLTSAFDLDLTAEQVLGVGVLSKLDQKQRESVSRAFEKIVSERSEDWEWSDVSVLSSEVKGNRAVVTAVLGEELVRVFLAARKEIWYVTEVENLDDEVEIFGDTLKSILKPEDSLARVRQILYKKPDQALKMLEEVIAQKGESAGLLFIKAKIIRVKNARDYLSQLKQEKDEKNQVKHQDDSTPILEKIAAKWNDYAPAQYALAIKYSDLEGDEKKAIPYFQQYAKLVPTDPRPWIQLSSIYENLKMNDEAEKSARSALERDQQNIAGHVKLITFFLRQSQTEKAKLAFGVTLQKFSNPNLTFEKVDSAVLHPAEEDVAPVLLQEIEKLFLSFPNELGKSLDGLRGLSEAQRLQKKYDVAIKTLQRAVVLSSQVNDQVTIAEIYRETKRFPQALLTANQALKMDRESPAAHYERACALAQLARKREAITSLKKALELDPELSYRLNEETDLKSLMTLPAFRALIPKKENQEEVEK